MSSDASFLEDEGFPSAAKLIARANAVYFILGISRTDLWSLYIFLHNIFHYFVKQNANENKIKRKRKFIVSAVLHALYKRM